MKRILLTMLAALLIASPALAQLTKGGPACLSEDDYRELVAA